MLQVHDKQLRIGLQNISVLVTNCAPQFLFTL
jgi:hypothetical protein